MGCCLCKCLIRRLGGASDDESKMYDKEESTLSDAALALIDSAFDGIDPRKILDVHVHLLGLHPDQTGCYVHENMDKCCHCVSYSKKRIMMQASGIQDGTKDRYYVDRLVKRLEHFVPPSIQHRILEDERNAKEKEKEKEKDDKNNDGDGDGDEKESVKKNTLSSSSSMYPKAVLLALDEVYSVEGEKEEKHTSVHTPSEYVERIVTEFPHLFTCGASIHPYRTDSIEKLKYYKSIGCRVIKWLPNAMGIDPGSDRCDRFYDTMKELDLILLTHTGTEHSLNDANYTFQEYGNPLRLRRALDKGVKVIMAHCASEGTDEDLEIQNLSQSPSVDLFLRLMEDKKYDGLLFGDISAMTAFRRIPALIKILKRPDIHHRLIYGSDYPVPCVSSVVWYSRLVSNNLITQAQSNALSEVFKYNPLLADFVLKRIIRLKDADSDIVYSFNSKIFQRADFLENIISDENNLSKPIVDNDDDDDNAQRSKELEAGIEVGTQSGDKEGLRQPLIE